MQSSKTGCEKYIKGDILLENIKRNLIFLEERLEDANSYWKYEDIIYRYYHESFKVYRIQSLIKELYNALEKISPHNNKRVFNDRFLKIISGGTKDISWEPKHNEKWDEICRPFLEAFFHSKYFLEMAIKYGKKYDFVPNRMDSGWAALLELYKIR